MTKALKGLAGAMLWVLLHTGSVTAQQAATVSGHVSAAGRALAGVRIRVAALNIERATDGSGYYSFLIPAARINGQTVELTASLSDRRVQYVPQSVNIVLNGGPLVRDFDLQRVQQPGGQLGTQLPAAAKTRDNFESTVAASSDSAGLGEPTGTTDVPAALAARFPGLAVNTSSTLGGTTALSYRGIRSFLGSSQSLFVVDGVIQDNTTFTSLAQRYGAGGFDYGSPLQDLNARDIASIKWLTGPDASARYGSRAANGVAVVTTKDASGGAEFAVGASLQFTPEKVVKLPSFQNAYGQGLAGKFQFFDGQGHGVNDAVDQNWGPALDGRPLAQASYTEPRQADIRFWNAQPDNVSNFYRDAITTNTNVTLQARRSLGSVWLGIGQRQSDGVIAESQLRRRDARLSVATQPSSALSVSATIAVAEMRNDDTPGSGFNQSNSAAQLTRLGRQVSTDSLRVHLRATDGQQISWNYAGQNNPYFAALANDNSRERNHLSGSASAVYTFDPTLAATAVVGSDYYRDDRHFSIASGWMGGFPFYASPGLFTTGGFQDDNTAAQRSNAGLRVEKTRIMNTTRWSFFGAADLATIHQRDRTFGLDSIQNVPPVGDTTSTATAPAALAWTGHGKTLGVAAGANVSYDDRATLGLTLRQEWVTVASDHQVGETYPSVQASLDAMRYVPALRFGGLLDGVNLRAGWWRAGSDATPYAVQTLYGGQTLSGGVVPTGSGLLSPAEAIGPETTTGWQVGADFSGFERRIGAGFTLYYENASDVLLPQAATPTTTLAVNAANLRNHGIEGFASVRGGDRDRSVFWELGGTASLNYNRVEDLGDDGVTVVPLGPTQFGVTVAAMKGLPFGEIVGYKLRRDPATGALLLTNGLPQADSVAGQIVLGQSRQNKLVGLRGTIGYRWVSLTAAGEGHLGGSVFSATTYNGDVSGSFAETGFRPDSGLLVVGVDAVTGQPNATHVTTEAYYHALGAVQEPWIYSASFFKLRELNLSVTVPTRAFAVLPFDSARLSVIMRNAYTWSHNKNFDPETLLSFYSYPGLELGQLPTVRSVGIQVSITP